jgi:catechol 2,3-dioxygenase-like lactoylglutathione lyase family enzyme
MKTMFAGVDHVGIGVTDTDAALEFFGERLGFSRVLFDHTGELPGLDELTHRTRTRARVVKLASRHVTPLGPGRIKLVQVLEDGGTPPLPPGACYGEVGICEVCVHARDVRSVHGQLLDQGCQELMEPVSAKVPPFDLGVELSYVADPGDGKIEILEWTGIWQALPGEPRLEGVNHVAFGVSDMTATQDFYATLGFSSQLVLESDGYFEPMRPWYDREMPLQHMVLVLPGQGAGIEPVQLHPETMDGRGEWGHRGPMEFAISVSNLDQAFDQLRASGLQFHSDPQTVDVGTGEWRYAYFQDPDGLYVSLVEARY